MKISLSVVKNSPKIVKISDDEYFFGEGWKDRIDNSRLSLINESQGGGVFKYKEGFKDGNRSYFEIGSAVHALVLESSYYLSDYDIPSSRRLCELVDYMFDMLEFDVNNIHDVKQCIRTAVEDIKYNGGRFTEATIDKIYESSIDYIRKRSEDNSKGYKDCIIYLPKNSRDTVNSCVYSLLNDKRIREHLYPKDDDISSYNVMNEFAISLDVRVTIDDAEIILPLKGKLDNLVLSEIKFDINDLKTTFHSAKDFMESYKRFHYYRQAAFYRFLAASMFPEIEFGEFNFLCVSTFDYSTCIKRVSNKEMEYGKKEFISLLILIAIVEMARRENIGAVNIFNVSSLHALACGFKEKVELISLMCFLKKIFAKKGEEITTRNLLIRIRKEKFDSMSEDLVMTLCMMIDSLYSVNDEYSVYNLTTAKEISNRINSILDKELPFASSEWDCKDDLPF